MIYVCSPSGKLVQIEYALQAVAAGAPSVGIKAKNGVVLAVEKKQKSILYDQSSITKVNSSLGKEGGYWASHMIYNCEVFSVLNRGHQSLMGRLGQNNMYMGLEAAELKWPCPLS